MSLDLTIPGLPPTNAADRRSHWAYHKVSKEWQGKTAAAVLEALGSAGPTSWMSSRLETLRTRGPPNDRMAIVRLREALRR